MTDQSDEPRRTSAHRFRRLRNRGHQPAFHNDFCLDFVEILEAIMRERSLTVPQLAGDLRIPAGMVERWISGEDSVTLECAAVYLEALGVKAKIQVV